jgi:plastocyanin
VHRLALLALALVLLAAGCGGGGSGDDSGGLPEASEGTTSGADYELFASEYSFAPPFLALEKPGTYTFSIRNDGNEPHNFTIKGLGGTENAQPGETKIVELTVKVGTVEFVCTLHEAEGMFGTLNVSQP